MSTPYDEILRTTLLAHAPLTALVGQRVALGAASEGWAMPWVIYTRTHEYERGLDGSILADHITVEVQCWALRAVQAAEVAAAAASALAAITAGIVTTRVGGYDAEMGADAVVLTFEWWPD